MTTADPAECWRLLRSTRADPPGYAKRGRRAAVYRAALEQAEQLWQAASALPHQTRPIALYYSLAQGLKALLAARPDKSHWEAIRSHGLTVSFVGGGAGLRSVDEVEVIDNGNGSFQQVASYVVSPTLPKSTSLGALVASLPQAVSIVGETKHPTPLKMQVSGNDIYDEGRNGSVSAWVLPVPPSLVPDGVHGNPSDPSALPEAADVRRWLAPYPTLLSQGTFSVAQIWTADTGLFSEDRLRLRWAVSDQALSYEEATRFLRKVSGCLPDGVDDPRSVAVLPAMAGNGVPLHPIATW